ncbi:hypothetical protein ACYRFS_12995 [Listeria kieliensis]
MGYIGYKRSVRSQEAISGFEVPLNHIKRELIAEFIDENEEFQFLSKVPIALIKFTAKQVGRSSWHHVSSYYNEIDHYSLIEIAEDLQKNLKLRQEEYQHSKKENHEVHVRKLVVAKVQVWGGSRKRPKLIGHEIVLGIEKNDWLYPISKAEQTKYNLSANKVENSELFEIEEYKNLVKKYPEFKAMKRQINAKVKELEGIKK